MDERSAIHLCLKHRDPVGFDFLARKYRREAYVHAAALLDNEQDALDACQDAFARAFRAMPQLSSLEQFYPWFYCILRNRCFNLIARRQTTERYREVAQQDAESAGETSSPSQSLEQQEEREQIRAALTLLSPEHREVLAMKYWEERTYEQIAGLLGIPRGTVMSRLFHARIALRDAMEKLERTIPPISENSK
jgi:RNA polymerase sigma-70 factor, ECF subfamily